MDTSVKGELQGFVDSFGIGWSKEKMAEKAYRFMESNGHQCYILNGKYIGVDGEEFQFIRSQKNACWVVKGIKE